VPAPQQTPHVEPLDVDGTRTVAVGAVLFLLAFLLLLPFYGRLHDAGKAWWVWTCLAGFGLGVVGWAYCRHRKHRRAAREAAGRAG
jgi:cbb3-type cytochrome oxidase subunit 3